MKKNILLIGYNYTPEQTGIGKYSGEMMEWLAGQGHACTVITTYPYYPHWSVQEPYRKKRFWYTTEHDSFDSGGSIKVVRCPIYVPSNPSGLKRIILDFTFLLSSFPPVFKRLLQKKKDLILAVAPSVLVGLPAAFLALAKKSDFVYHIQDMQIEAARDLGMIKSGFLLNALFAVERAIFKSCTAVSTISDEMRRRLAMKTEKEIFLFPNWTDTSTFHPIKDKAKLKAYFGFEPNAKIALYSGGIGKKQGLEAILLSAQALAKLSVLNFVICGTGHYKEELMARADSLGLENVTFMPLQPYEHFNNFLNMADVHLVIQKASASDLMMPSKLTTILACGGLALITANEDSGLHRLAHAHKMAITVEAENQDALTEGIKRLIDQEAHRAEIGLNARRYAEHHLDISQIMGRFSDRFIA